MQHVGGGRQRTQGLKANLMLLAGSLVVALGVAEMVARLTFSSPLPWMYPQLRYRNDPDLVFTLAPDQVAFSADKPVRINSRGLRGDIVEFAPRAGTLRLLWLGDSIVFGFGVSDEEVVAQRAVDRLQEMHISAESINTGVPAYNTEQEVAFMVRDGRRYHPDWVILGFCWNDINDQLGARVCPEGWLVSRSAPEGGCGPSFMESRQGYAVRNAVKRFRLAYAVMESVRTLQEEMSPDDHFEFRSEIIEGRDTTRVRAGWARVEEAVHHLRILGEEAQFQTLVVAFPLPVVLEKAYPKSEYPSRLREIARREGLPFLDLEPSFRRAYRGHESLFIPYDADHPNAMGHDLAASEIARVLVDLTHHRADAAQGTPHAARAR
jgi:lysophospholipase L1-like esterase